jgi:hypothetical protein
MECKQIADRIEISPDYNLFNIRATNDFIRSLTDPKWHGFDKPPRRVWTVLDTPETREKLRGRGWRIGKLMLSSIRNREAMFTDLERLIEMLKF